MRCWDGRQSEAAIVVDFTARPRAVQSNPILSGYCTAGGGGRQAVPLCIVGRWCQHGSRHSMPRVCIRTGSAMPDCCSDSCCHGRQASCVLQGDDDMVVWCVYNCKMAGSQAPEVWFDQPAYFLAALSGACSRLGCGCQGHFEVNCRVDTHPLSLALMYVCVHTGPQPHNVYSSHSVPSPPTRWHPSSWTPPRPPVRAGTCSVSLCSLQAGPTPSAAGLRCWCGLGARRERLGE